ncbi:hypothetical protein [Albidovulum sp.]|uniref:hypothetical protein n=1 Tax=Albidovulum sp. TaxID=1872424 RepID=UPI0039B89F31
MILSFRWRHRTKGPIFAMWKSTGAFFLRANQPAIAVSVVAVFRFEQVGRVAKVRVSPNPAPATKKARVSKWLERIAFDVNRGFTGRF